MITIQREPLKIFTYEQLGKKAQKKATAEHKKFLIAVFNPEMYDESCRITKTEYRQTLENEEVIESILINEYLFYEDGELTSCVRYVDGHDRAGEIILTHDGVEYEISELVKNNQQTA